jgi:pilus assembly protein CpaB
MPAKTILTVLFLISLGVVVILGFRALPKRGDSNTPTTDEILVATAALPPGTLLRAKDVVWHLSGTAEPDQILRPAGVAGKANPELDQQARADVYGAALRAGVSAGDPITHGAFVKPGDRDFLQTCCPPGRER